MFLIIQSLLCHVIYLLSVFRFFGHLLSILYTLDCDNVVIAGDLNARIVGLHDLIPDVDNISNRVNKDDTKSGHYEEMTDFFLDMKFCVVNGRVTKEYDNYTCVSSRGSSVVDYMLVPHFTLEQCDSFKVHLVKDLIDPTIITVESLPDHSALELCIKMGFTSDMITIAILIYVTAINLVNKHVENMMLKICLITFYRVK